MKKTSIPNPVEILGNIKCHRTIKSPSSSTIYNYQKTCSWWIRSKTIVGIGRKAIFSRWSASLLFKSLPKTLLTTERRLIWLYFLVVNLFQMFLITRTTTDETFQKSGKQDSFKKILKSSPSIYENLGSQFFRTE